MIGFSGIYDFLNKVHLSQSKFLIGQGLLNTKISNNFKTERLSFHAAGDEFSVSSTNKIIVAVSGNIYGIRFKNTANYVLNKYNKESFSNLSKLNGNYLILINDLVLNKLLIITDENTVAPFYYIVQNKKFIFSWDISRLLKIK